MNLGYLFHQSFPSSLSDCSGVWHWLQDLQLKPAQSSICGSPWCPPSRENSRQGQWTARPRRCVGEKPLALTSRKVQVQSGCLWVGLLYLHDPVLRTPACYNIGSTWVRNPLLISSCFLNLKKKCLDGKTSIARSAKLYSLLLFCANGVLRLS